MQTPVPEAFVASLEEQFGVEEGRALAASLDTPPSVSIRLNSSKRPTLAEAPDTSDIPDVVAMSEKIPVPWAQGGYRLSERPSFTLDPLLHAGAYYVQDAASMYLSVIVGDIVHQEGGRPLRVLDLCAAPGGKSVSAIEVLPEGSVIVSNEVVPPRAAVLRENMLKWGWPAGIVASAPAERWGEMQGHFDIIIVDAPCSGEGMMRKEEVARSQWSPQLVEQCAVLQREIVEAVIPALRPGGWLVYSTCTFNSHENEENVEWFCRELGLEQVGESRRFTPLHDGTEGLFVAVMKRGDNSDKGTAGVADGRMRMIDINRRDRKVSKGGKRGNDRQVVSAEILKEASSWLSRPERWNVLEEKGKVLALPAELQPTVDALPTGLRVLSKGVELGELKGCDLVPSHSLALSRALRPGAFPIVELDKESALGYLRRETPALPVEEGKSLPKGYMLATYHGLPLGFLKNLGTRYNNLYPKDWRILKR